MRKPIINYPFGGGGRWLSHVLWSLENNLEEFPVLNEINFHKGKITAYYNITHYEHETSADYIFSGLCKFNIFLNSWIKFYSAENYLGFNDANLSQQVSILADEVVWRMGWVLTPPLHQNGEYVKTYDQKYFKIYEQKIDLDYSNLFLDTVKFRDQLLDVLSEHWPKEYVPRVTQTYIDFAAAEYRVTAIDPKLHIGNVQSTGWLAWCAAQCRINEPRIRIPVDIGSDIDGYKDWLSSNQDWIIEKTQIYTI